jgi:hypothetical protein
VARVKWADSFDTAPAEAAGTVVENREFSHVFAFGPL